MAKWVVLEFGNGNFEQGFPVTLRIGEDGTEDRTRIPGGYLPPALYLLQLFQEWQEAFNQWVKLIYSEIKMPHHRGILPKPGQTTNISFCKLTENLAAQLNDWLNSNYGNWQKIRDKLQQKLSEADEIRLIIQTEDIWLRRLPWQAWNLFTDGFPRAEFAVSPSVIGGLPPCHQNSSKIRILAILGNTLSQGVEINIDRDKQELERLPGVVVEFLVQPTHKELVERLGQQTWHILFFAGHSHSEWDGSSGWIEIAPGENLAIDRIKETLKTAIENGLQLAIFNSCDGLGLARQLEDLHLHSIIVMREIVPDRVAQQFLQDFLRAFASNGENRFLHDAVRQARRQLQDIWSKIYPGISWLPVICQQYPEAEPLTWKKLRGASSNRYQPGKVGKLEFPNGAVALNSPFYVERPPIESECYQEILKPGSMLRIKAPSNMGKTSLLLKILDSANQQGYRTVYLDLKTEKSIFHHLDNLLEWLCKNVARQLKLSVSKDDYCDGDAVNNDSCIGYLQDRVLEQLDSNLVLVLDNIHLLFDYQDIAEDFLSLLRQFHEQAKLYDIWKRMRLVVAHSTEVYIRLNAYRSPFNVGLPIKLPEFDQQQVQDLARRHGLTWEDGESAKKLMEMVGGYPYLIRLALYSLAPPEVTLDLLLEQAPTHAGIYSDHLRGLLEHLRQKPELAAVLKEVVRAEKPLELESISVYHLDSLGLVHLAGNKVSPSCELYRQYFRANIP